MPPTRGGSTVIPAGLRPLARWKETELLLKTLEFNFVEMPIFNL